jgi:hypothetical protein
MTSRSYFERSRHHTAENVHGKHGRGGKGGVENDSSPHLVDTTGRDGVYNHGTVTERASNGQTVIEAYGLDRSTMVGPADCERGFEPAGGFDDLSHSIKGAKSVQGTDRGGRRDTTDR